MKRVTSLLLCIALCSATVFAETLTVERLFSSPSLSGAALAHPKLLSDGSVSFLKARDDEPSRQDLWLWSATDGLRLIIDSKVLAGDNEQLTDEEKARRERLRLFASGITEYEWHPDGFRVLLPIAGRLFIYDRRKAGAAAVREVVEAGNGVGEAHFSPQGRYISFIRDKNLFVADANSLRVKALTLDGSATISYGSAEFIAQEELDRFEGYWWAPNDQYLAFSKVDESGVDIAKRSEIYADRFTVFEQRYPRAGTANAVVQLGVYDMLSDSTQWLDWTSHNDVYLARVNWFPDSRRVLVQRLSRDQRNLDLVQIDTLTNKPKVILNENSKHWINVHDVLHFVGRDGQFVWASERNGFRHLYWYNSDGKQLKQISDGPFVVDSLCAVDEAGQSVYALANADTPLERHLYRFSLNGGERVRITQEAGWHQSRCVVNNGVRVLDTFSSPRVPSRVSVLDAQGQVVHTVFSNEWNESHPYAPYLAQHVDPEFGSFKAEDGQDIYYKLLKPATLEAGKKYPVIFDIYGGPHAQRVARDFGGRSSFWHQLMVQKGFVVVTVDNRGMANRGMTFESVLHRKMGQPEVRDQQAAVHFLRTLPYIDGERIGVFGWSYGGYMTLNLLFKAGAEFKAGVAVAPVTDWALYDTAYTERYMGHPVSDSEAYKASSVFPYVPQFQGKLLLVHGMADDNVLFTHSTQLMAALQAQNKPFELMTYPGSKHAIFGQAQRTHLYNAITDFFVRHLQPSSLQPSSKE